MPAGPCQQGRLLPNDPLMGITRDTAERIIDVDDAIAACR